MYDTHTVKARIFWQYFFEQRSQTLLTRVLSNRITHRKSLAYHVTLPPILRVWIPDYSDTISTKSVTINNITRPNSTNDSCYITLEKNNTPHTCLPLVKINYICKADVRRTIKLANFVCQYSIVCHAKIGRICLSLKSSDFIVQVEHVLFSTRKSPNFLECRAVIGQQFVYTQICDIGSTQLIYAVTRRNTLTS